MIRNLLKYIVHGACPVTKSLYAYYIYISMMINGNASMKIMVIGLPQWLI